MKRLKGTFLVASGAALGLAAPASHAAETVVVSALSAAPAIDGDLFDWGVVPALPDTSPPLRNDKTADSQTP